MLERSNDGYQQLSPSDQLARQPRASSRRRKRKKMQPFPCFPTDKKLGYDKKLEINFLNMLHKNGFYEKIDAKHLLQQIKADENEIMTQILNQGVGVVFPPLRLTHVNSTKLPSILKAIAQKWQEHKIKYFLLKECPSQRRSSILKNLNHLTPTKCYFDPHMLQLILSAAPILQNKSEEEALIRSEFEESLTLIEDNYINRALHWKMVYRFLLAIVKYILPLELFGSLHNRRCLQNSIKTLLSLGKKDVTSLGRIMFEVKTSHCKWAKSLRSFALRSKLVAKVWLWILNDLIIPILTSFFYITDTACSTYQLLFFRKRDFQGPHDAAFHKLLKKESFYELHPSEADILKNSRNPSQPWPPTLRFIPKAKGLRPIHSLRGGGLSPSDHLKARLLLQYLVPKIVPEARGATLPQFQARWCQFIEGLNECQELFAVKIDLQDAYGSIKVKLLLSLLSDACSALPPQLLFVRCPPNSLKPSPAHRYFPLEPTPANWAKAEVRVDVCQALRSVKKVVLGQVAKVGSQWLLKVKGVAQGGTLSSLLCDLYLGAMVKEHLLGFCSPGRLLVRFVDDFMFASSDREEAVAFLEAMQGPIGGEFGCNVNARKTDHNLDGQQRRLAFRGLLLCTASKQLLVPIAPLAPSPPRYTMQLNRATHLGQFLFLKMNQILRARTPAVLFHPAYASTGAVVTNVWRVGMSVGARLVALLSALLLPDHHYNPIFLARGIATVATKLWNRLDRLWRRSSKSLDFGAHFCRGLFTRALLAMLGWPRHPPLTPLRRILKATVRRHTEHFTQREQELWPRETGSLRARTQHRKWNLIIQK